MNDKSTDRRCPSASSSRRWSWSGIEMISHCLSLEIVVPRQLPAQRWEHRPACACGMLRGQSPALTGATGTDQLIIRAESDQLVDQPPVPAAILLPAVARKLEKLFVLPSFVWPGQRKGIQMFTHTHKHTSR